MEIAEIRADCLSDSAAGEDECSRIFDVDAFVEKPIRGIRFRNIRARADTAGVISAAANWTAENASFLTRDGRPVRIVNSESVAATAFAITKSA